jgi:hypothetical protein
VRAGPVSRVGTKKGPAASDQDATGQVLPIGLFSEVDKQPIDRWVFFDHWNSLILDGLLQYRYIWSRAPQTRLSMQSTEGPQPTGKRLTCEELKRPILT